MKILTEVQAAYLAGIIDGEGCVFIQINEGVLRKNYSLQCIVASTNFELLYWILETTGVGSIHKRHSRPGNLQGWNYVSTTLNAKSILESVLPYLIVKKEQAILGIELQKLCTSAGLRATSEQMERKAYLAQRIKDLKRVGVVPVPIG